MEAMRSWLKYIRKHWVAILVVAIILVVVVAFIIVEVRVYGTGFNGYTKVSTATEATVTPRGGPPQKVTTTSEPQPSKTLWDWLQLLFVPTVLAFGTIWFTARQNHDREIAEGNQHEAALQGYIDNMSELLLKKHLGELLPDGKADQKYRQQQNGKIKDELKPEYEAVRQIAHVRTVTTFSRLDPDPDRKGRVLHFLYASKLIMKGNKIVDLSNADLRKANLFQFDKSGADLSGTDLSEANLSEANLSRTDLSRAKLIRTDLRGADLSLASFSYADLRGADLRGANLRSAWLEGAKLQGANLSKTNLTDATLLGAQMTNKTNLSDAKLEGAKYNEEPIPTTSEKTGVSYTIEKTQLPKKFDYLRADLKIVTAKYFNQAKSLKAATMPDGSIHP